METFLKMVNTQSILFIYLAVGYYCRKKNIFTDETRNKLSDFVVLITLPCMVFSSFRMDFSMDALTVGVSVTLSGMPIGSTTAILPQKYGADAQFASKCVFISTVTSLVTVPVLTLFI